ncbi:MAG: CPBP family intramembrane metalloprotease [Parachlamydiales bacterium]|nr:CPBP family intramembrane metalloprotease [Parachlamydiales bacterium]
MSCGAIRIVNRENETIFRGSCDSPKIGTGVLASIAVYPVVHYAIEGVCDLMAYFKFELTESQDAVRLIQWIQEIGSTVVRTALLTTFLFYVVILGPILEEAIFRGGFNGWMKTKMEGWGYDVINNTFHKAIYWTICGTVFGLAHLSPTQGWANIPIVIGTSLVGIACSALKDEESKDITAPCAAHMAFNGISVTRLLLKA